jgi:hypothetical protein
LIPYAIAFCTLGVPLLALETGLGQGLGKSALGAFEDLSPRLKGLGWVCFVSTCGIVVYYNVVLAWCRIPRQCPPCRQQAWWRHRCSHARPNSLRVPGSPPSPMKPPPDPRGRGRGQVLALLSGELRCADAGRAAVAERPFVPVLPGPPRARARALRAGRQRLRAACARRRPALGSRPPPAAGWQRSSGGLPPATGRPCCGNLRATRRTSCARRLAARTSPLALPLCTGSWAGYSCRGAVASCSQL